jgi:hypothetical protein
VGSSRVPFGFEGGGRKFCTPQICDVVVLYNAPTLKCCAQLLRLTVTLAGYDFFVSGNGGNNEVMTIPDYVAVGLLLTLLLAAARWFAERKFEL